ncbi:MAG: hemerythrin family protein [Ethanoligenens sp.]
MIWKDSYRIGIELVDTQHIELFERVTDFIETLQTPGNWEEKLPKIKSTMVFMEEYVVTHFDSEEAYQKKINYPDFENHHHIHEAFKAEVGRFAAELEQNGYQRQTVQQLAGKLLAWLINHVVVTDHKIADFVATKGEIKDVHE